MTKLLSKTRRLIIIGVIVAVSVAASSEPAFSGVYHEANCPSVDTTKMTRMKRSTAEAVGLLPAPDCHPDVRVRYLGVSGASPGLSASEPTTIQVGGYSRTDGTHVNGYTRPAHNRTSTDSQN